MQEDCDQIDKNIVNSTLPYLLRKEDDYLESSTPNVQIDQQVHDPEFNNDFLEEFNDMVCTNDKRTFQKAHRNLSSKYSKMDWIISLIRKEIDNLLSASNDTD